MKGKKDNEAFRKILSVLQVMFDKELPEETIETYYRALKDLDIGAVERAAGEAAKRCKFFPKPAELREFIQGTPDDAAAQAWEGLELASKKTGGYEAVLFVDGAIAHALQIVFGQWSSCVESLATLSPEMTRARYKEFTECWKRARRTGNWSAKYVPGRCETNNLAVGGKYQRDPSKVFKQRVWIQDGDGSRWVTADYDPVYFNLVTPLPELALMPADRPRLPAAETRQLTDGAEPLSPEETQKMAREFYEQLSDFLAGKRLLPPEGIEPTRLPPPGEKPTPEEVEERRQTLKRQAAAISEAEQ